MRYIIIFLICLLCIAVQGCARGDDAPPLVTIMVAAVDGVTVESENPLVISSGGDAEFALSFSEGYMLVSIDNAGPVAYNNGVLRVSNARFPTTIRLNVRPVEYIINNIAAGGMIRFESSPDGQYIRYNANGGFVAGTGFEYIYYEVRTHHYPCPNAFGDTRIFTREGYALLEYNTEPDGSGVAVNLGGNAVMGGRRVLGLYAQWVRYTDASLFEYTESGGNITITGYHGGEYMLVIPEYINGRPVTAIGERAISCASLRKLVLTRNLVTLSPEAILNCPNLETLYFSDSIMNVGNSSIINTPRLANLRVNAVQPPRHSNALAWGSAMKYKRLITAPGNRLVLISGSSSAFGLYSPLLAELLNHEYEIVNFGTHAIAPALFFLEFTANKLRENELVILAPEPFAQQQGSNRFEPILWQLVEGYYDAFRYVDIRNYENVFGSFAEFNAARRNLTPLTYAHYTPDVNLYGDMITHRPNREPGFAEGWNSIAFNIAYLDAEGAARLNRINSMINARGSRMYWSFAPANINALNAQSRSDAVQAAYDSNIWNLVDFPVISRIQNYIMPGYLFYDTEHHPSTEGAMVRTRQLARDIRAQREYERALRSWRPGSF